MLRQSASARHAAGARFRGHHRQRERRRVGPIAHALQQLPLGGINAVGRFRATGMLRAFLVHLAPGVLQSFSSGQPRPFGRPLMDRIYSCMLVKHLGPLAACSAVPVHRRLTNSTMNLPHRYHPTAFFNEAVRPVLPFSFGLWLHAGELQPHPAAEIEPLTYPASMSGRRICVRTAGSRKDHIPADLGIGMHPERASGSTPP